MNWLSVLLLVWGLSGCANVSGQECNICTSYDVACVTETQFQYCSADGVPQGAISTCNAGFVCSTLNTTICLPRSDDVLVSCLGCNACDYNGVFACTGIRTYVLCLGVDTPPTTTPTIGTCPVGYVCNVYSPQICTSSATLQPTCNVEEVTTTSTVPTTSTTTTPAPVTDPTTYCKTVQQPGRFDASSANCKEYVYCFTNKGVWGGQLYTCAGSTYFNSTTRLCGADVPLRCRLTTANDIEARSLWEDDTSTFEPAIVPSTGNTADDYCESVQETGRFAAGDSACKQFVKCYLKRNIWGGQLYVCPQNTYFNASTQQCEENPPVECAGV